MIEEFHHVAIGVSDLDKAVEFYTETLGMELDYSAHHIGAIVDKVVNIENAELDVQVVKKDGIRLELIDYVGKKKKDGGYTEQDSLGLLHICFRVSEIDKEYERIKSLGWKPNTPPVVTRENGPKLFYFKGPDNVIIELYEKQ